MFLEVDGPTAIRADMVHTMSFSVGSALVEDATGSESSVSALAAVWNGRLGFVAVLIRSLECPSVRRFAYDGSIHSVNEIGTVVEQALDFLASLGFVMEEPAFHKLRPPSQQARIDRWNKLRKPRAGQPLDEFAEPRSPAYEIDRARDLAKEMEAEGAEAVSGSGPPTSDLWRQRAIERERMTSVAESVEPDPDAVPAGVERTEEAAAPVSSEGEVLGRIELVPSVQPLSPRGRLLGSF